MRTVDFQRWKRLRTVKNFMPKKWMGLLTIQRLTAKWRIILLIIPAYRQSVLFGMDLTL